MVKKETPFMRSKLNQINFFSEAGNKVKDLSYKYSSFYALDESSYMWGWGLNLKLDAGAVSSPTMLSTDRQFASLVWGADAALDESSYVWAWAGYNNVLLGVGKPTTSKIKRTQKVIGDIQWKQLCGNGWHTNGFLIGLNSNNYAWAWGFNGDGNLGINTTTVQYSPVSVVGGRQFLKLAIGQLHTCALDMSSYAWTWGGNNSGGIGDGAAGSRSSPVSVIGGRQFIDIICNQNSTYGIDSSSFIWAWGYNTNGLLGDGTVVNRSSPVSNITGAQDKFFTCGYTVMAKPKGVTYYNVWGNNTGGNFGNNTITSTSTGTAVQVVFPFEISKYIGTGSGSSEASIILDTLGRVWVFGYNANSYLGDLTNVSKSYPGRILPTQRYTFNNEVTFLNKKFISNNIGYDTVNQTKGHILLDESSYAWMWGTNRRGGMGCNAPGFPNQPSIIYSSPVSVVGNRQFRQVSIAGTVETGIEGLVIAGGIDSSSYAWMWGSNEYNSLGDNGNIPTTDGASSPISVVGDKQWLKLVINGICTAAIDLSSYVWTWGRNPTGSLGDNTTTNRSSPVSVVGGKQVIDLVTPLGSASSFAVLDSSSYAWTWGTALCLGDNLFTSKSSPVSVVGNRQFVKIFGGIACFFGLDANSYIWAWGANTAGRLGDNTTTNRSSPVSVVGGMQFSKIGSSCALTASSALWVWSDNGGNNIVSAITSSPVSVVGDYKFVDFGMGWGAAELPFSEFCMWGDGDRYYNFYNHYLASNKGDLAMPYGAASPIAVQMFQQSPKILGSVVRKNLLGY